MIDYTGIKCPVCDVPFQATDDIVVCPECGAPYHRACYRKEGQCIFQENHALGKDWQPPAPPTPPNPSVEIKDRECPQCGILNAHSALFCNHCGASLLGEPQKYQNDPNRSDAAVHRGDGVPPPGPPPFRGFPPNGNPQGGFPPGGNSQGGFPPPPFGSTPFAGFDPMAGVSPTEPLEDNVTFGDASKLVRQNTAYYMAVFSHIKRTRKNKFNLSAFLFSGAWMLYRKQYKMGAIITSIMFGLYLAYLMVTMFVSSPVLLDLMTQVGMDTAGGLTASFAPNNDQMLAITELLMKDPVLYLKLSLPLICLTAMLVVMIIIGVRGNKMYLSHCVKTVRSIKASPQGSDLSVALEARGGVNTSIALCLFACYMIATYLPAMFR